MNMFQARSRRLVAVLGITVFAGALIGAASREAASQPLQDGCSGTQAATQPQGESTMGPDMMKKMMGKMSSGEGMPGMCPMCAGMMGGQKSDGDMMAQCKGMMNKMGMSEDMVKRWDAMMHTPIFLDSPCAIYGQADRLGLTDEQRQQLIDIENEARAKSMGVLTDEQRETLGDVPDTPMPMVKMCQEMQSKMKPMMQEMMGAMGMSPDSKGAAGSCCSGNGS